MVGGHLPSPPVWDSLGTTTPTGTGSNGNKSVLDGEYRWRRYDDEETEAVQRKGDEAVRERETETASFFSLSLIKGEPVSPSLFSF